MDNTEQERVRIIRRAGMAALAGNLLLAAIKLLLARRSGSLAVLGDGIDSATDVLIAIVMLVISGIVSKPGDKEHPWGHARAETIATMLLALIILLTGGELCISSAKKLLTQSFTGELSPLAPVAGAVSIAGKLLLALSQYHLGKKARSDIIRANAENMRNDVVLSAAVLAALVAAHVFRAPALDPAIAALVGLWIVRNAFLLFRDLSMELMDGNTDGSLYGRIFRAALSVEGVQNPHRARIRKLAAQWDIVLDIEVQPHLTVYEAHEKAEQVEDAIRKAIPDVYDVVIHIEPAGSDAHQRQETYGLSPQSITG